MTITLTLTAVLSLSFLWGTLLGTWSPGRLPDRLPVLCRSASANMQSAEVRPDVISGFLSSKLRAGWVLGRLNWRWLHKKTAASIMYFPLHNFLHDIICMSYVCGCSMCFQLPILNQQHKLFFQGIHISYYIDTEKYHESVTVY